MRELLTGAAVLAALTTPCARAQGACSGTTIAGVVKDNTQAVIAGAKVLVDGGRPVTSATDGRYRVVCVADGVHRLTVTAAGFAEAGVSLTTPRAAAVDVVLGLAEVQTTVEVSDAAEGAPASASASGPAQTIEGKRLQTLADDPDDLERELRQLAVAGGGSPANVTIAVDGFQGESKLPPKSSIAYIKVNPDQFSAEYREPPFDGARVEVYTRPGQKAYHGALFTTNGSSWMIARDPFSVSKGSLGKQRDGFELGGPVRRQGSDFALTLEQRAIDNVAAVNAITLDAGGNAVSTLATVPAPQRLWLGTARLDWQLGAKNTFISTFSANVNDARNLGVGGSTLASAAYEDASFEHMLRVSDITTVSAHLMHEARVSFKWTGNTSLPVSTAPQVQVAGAFTGGGATQGADRLREFEVEADDNAIWTTKRHTLKFGTQYLSRRVRWARPINFNGTYTFGGGPAPALDASGRPTGQTLTITGLEQYRRSLLGLAGGTPTAYSNVAGNPELGFLQVRNALFAQDDWNLGHGVKVSYGLRYFLQNDPETYNSVTPRLGVLWSPATDGKWTLHAHVGLFSGRFGTADYAEVLREDGLQRVTSTVYNPVYGSPFSGGAVAIHSARQFAPHISNVTWGAENIGGTRSLPLGINLSIDYYLGRIWNATRSVNINSPLNGQPYGPRALGIANLNRLEVQNSGQGRVNAVFAGVEDHKYKRLQFFVGGVRVNLVDDADNDLFFTPQSAFSNAGEFAHRTSQGTWNVFGNATLALPAKVQVSTNFNANGEKHYNITTGFDNNGDGNFNDRPGYAPAGTPGAIATQYGWLTASGGTGVFPRNQGVMPWGVYMDANVQRAFVLTHNPRAEHQQTVSLNLRSSNVLNHRNVTQVGGVLGSPLFGQAYAADNGRRVEAGVRYSF